MPNLTSVFCSNNKKVKDTIGKLNSETLNNSTDKELKKRATWGKEIDFLLALIGSCAGLGNVWRFPYLCYKNGGGAFLIPYFLSVFIGGVPMFFLEVSLGQFMSAGGMQAWKICPILKGLGFASAVVVFLMNLYYNVILGWALHFLFASFTSKLPWSSCNNTWNTLSCTEGGSHHVLQETSHQINTSSSYEYYHSNNSTIPFIETNNSLQMNNSVVYGIDPATEYWEHKVLHLSKGIEDIGTVQWDLALCLLLAWIIVYFCIWKGVKLSGKIVYFTATLPYVLMTILLVRAVTLPGAMKGIRYYVIPDFSKLSDAGVWVEAGTQIVFSYSISMGTLTALGSYNKFNHNCWKDTLVFSAINSVICFFAGFVVFAVLGFMADQQGVPIDMVAESGPGLAFVAYPKAVSQMPIAPLWSILFFFMIILLGLDSQFTCVEGFVTAVSDQFPKTLRKGNRRELFTALLCAVSCGLGLFMVTNSGMYVFQLFDYYTANSTILLITFFECIAIAWLYGVNRYYDNLETMLGFRINIFMKICWVVITPIFTGILFVQCVITYSDPTYNRTYVYPDWAIGLGWIIGCSSVVMIPVVAVYELRKTSGPFKERVSKLIRFQPQEHQISRTMPDFKKTSVNAANVELATHLEPYCNNDV